MRHYKHLSIEERENLYLLKGQQRSIRSIARELERSPSTISRELKRGHSGHRPYLPSSAQYRYEKRRENCGRKTTLSNPNGHLRKANRFSTKLRRKGKKYKHKDQPNKQSQFEIKHHLKERPQEADGRSGIGHCEGNTAAGKRGSSSLFTITDRCSRFTLAAKVSNRKAETVRDKMIELLCQLPDVAAKSVTPYRGREFA